MQRNDQPVWVQNGSATVYMLWAASLTGISGTFAAGDGLSFTSGAVGVVVDFYGANALTFYVTSSQQPVAGDTVTSDASPAASATVGSFDTAPDLAGASIDGEEFFVRQGDGAAYIVSSVPTNSSLTLTAPYGGVSSVADEALATLHSTRTVNFGLPNFDRRDRELQVLLSQLALLVDAALQDHEDRIAALETP